MKLKTFKEIETMELSHHGSVNLEDVRREAIKWIKDFQFKLYKLKGYSSYYEGHRKMLHTKISIFKEFFNITEDEYVIEVN